MAYMLWDRGARHVIYLHSMRATNTLSEPLKPSTSSLFGRNVAGDMDFGLLG